MLLWLASPAVGLGPLAWIALTPLALITLRRPEAPEARAAPALAYALYLELLLVPALPFGIAENQWGDPPLPVMVRDSPVVAAAFLYVPLLALLLFAVRFPQPLPALARRSAAAAVVVPAVVWTALDVVRTKLDPAGLWGGIFLTQHGEGSRQLAALAGPWTLTFLVVATGYALALVLLRRRAVLAPLVGVTVATAVAALLTADGGADPRTGVRIAVVQPGYDTAEYDERPARAFAPERRDLERGTLDLVDDLAPLTREAAARGAHVVVWPEAVAWADPRAVAPVREAIAALAREASVPIVVPAFLAGPNENSAFAVTADGDLLEPQPKQRPMWFLGERRHGGPAAPLDLDPPRVGVLLGIDNGEPAPARGLVSRGATVLASATHDWRELAEQQRAFARLNAAALGRPLARADWRYGSFVVGALGQVLVDAGLERERTVLVAGVGSRTALTPYARGGDVPAWATVVAAAALVVAGAVQGRRRHAAR